jgi:hypothetical protein
VPEGNGARKYGKEENMGGIKLVSVSLDGETRFFGLGETGVGHALTIPAGFQGDPLSLGTVDKGCGGKGLDASRLTERGQGDAVCKRCTTWLGTPAGIDAANGGRADWPGSDIAPDVREVSPEVREIVKASKGANVKRRKDAAIVAEKARLAEQKEARENSAPATFTGKNVTEMRTETAAFYAAGGKPSAEILALPDPSVARQWAGTESGTDAGIMVCEFKGAPVDGSDTDGVTGKCPQCPAIVALTPKGRVGKHNVGGVKAPAGKGLKSKSIPAVEHGNVPGDTAAADKRRAAEIGTGEDSLAGTAKFKGGADAGRGARDHGSVDGSANVGRVNLAPVQPGGWLGKAGTGQLPMSVRPGIDAGVTGKICPLGECGGQTVDIAHKGKSDSWRRRHSSKVGAVLRDRAARRESVKAAEIERGEAIPVAERRELRKAASVGSFAEGVNAHTGIVTHGPRPVAGTTSGKGRKAKRKA